MGQITVKCPCCREVMEVDSRTGKVEKHHPEVKAAGGGDLLAERLRSLKEEKARRESVVADSRKREREKGSAHEALFSKVKEKMKEGPAEKPLRDIDID